MADFDDVIFDDDEFADNGEGNQSSQNTEDDLTSEVLKARGISDPSKIKFEEDGQVVEKDWNSLDREEQLNILIGESEKVAEENTQFTNDEMQLIQSIRNSGMSIEDYFSSLQAPPEKTYDVDQLSDDDVYALDLLQKVGEENITDEEITQALEQAKSNEALFKKTVDSLRNNFKKIQDDAEQQAKEEQEKLQKEEYNQFASTIYNEIANLNSFVGNSLELDKQDQEDLASFTLSLDQNGLSPFGAALRDPKIFTKAAFFILNEDKIVQELDRQMKEQYNRGYEAAKQESAKVEVTPTRKIDAFADEDDW